MTDLDQQLGNRLERLAEAVPVHPGLLDPVYQHAVEARMRVRGAWLTPLVVVSVLTLIAVGVSGQGSPTPTPAPIQSGTTGPSTFDAAAPQVATARDGRFQLQLRSSKSLYSPNEAIDVTGSLLYDGDRETVDITTDSSGPIMFSLREPVFGEIDVGGLSLLMCGTTTLHRGEPLDSPFKKSGGFSGDHPDADTFMAWMRDPVFTLPEGTWHVVAVSAAPCLDPGSPRFSLRAEIEIVVDDDPNATPGQPPASPSTNKPVYGGDDAGWVGLQLKSERAKYEAGTPIELFVSYTFADGPELLASHGTPELTIWITQQDVTLTYELGGEVMGGQCVDLGRVDGKERNVSIGPETVTTYRAQAAGPDTIADLFDDDGLHLAVGRWRILASVDGTLGTCAAPGDPYTLRAFVEIEVVDHLE